MRKIKLALKLSSVVACCVITAGCVCVSFNPAGENEDNWISLSSSKKYQIANAETIVLTTTSSGDPLSASELNMMTQALRNTAGNDFGKVWNSAAPEINRVRGYEKVLTNDTDAFKVASRVLAPNVFDGSPNAVQVQIKSLVIERPAETSPWWLPWYILTISMSPMRDSSLGTAIVAVLDDKGNTIGTKVVVFRRSYWTSGLLPTAAMCGGKYSTSKGDPGNMNNEEKSLLNQIITRAAVDIMNINSGTMPASTPEWINIRSAVIESIIAGNDSAAVTLLENCKKQSIGGKECKDLLDLID